MDPSIYLAALEAEHRAKVGENFAYHPVQIGGSGLYQLAIVRKHEPGYYPISLDFAYGNEAEMQAEADRLNDKRMSLTRRDAAIIIASSMAAQNRFLGVAR